MYLIMIGRKDRTLIRAAMEEWKTRSRGCVSFRPAKPGDRNQILISNRDRGCYSGVGRWYFSTTQNLNLGQGCMHVGYNIYVTVEIKIQEDWKLC